MNSYKIYLLCTCFLFLSSCVKIEKTEAETISGFTDVTLSEEDEKRLYSLVYFGQVEKYDSLSISLEHQGRLEEQYTLAKDISDQYNYPKASIDVYYHYQNLEKDDICNPEKLYYLFKSIIADNPELKRVLDDGEIVLSKNGVKFNTCR